MNLGSTPFFAYEGLRILVPGLLLYALLLAAEPAYADVATVRDTTGGISIILGSGFLLYFVDVASLTPSYKDQPAVNYLRSLDPSLDRYEVLNRYFVAFDTLFPQGLRDRSSYYTEIYRIGVEAILLGVSAQALFWARWRVVGADPLPLGAAAIPIAGVLVVFVVTCRSTRKKLDEPYVAYIRDQVGPLGVGLLLASAGALFASHVMEEWWLHAATLVAIWLVWARRAIVGVPGPGKDERVPLSPDASLVLFLLLTCVSTLGNVDADVAWADWEPHGATLQWMIFAVAAAILIGARGHERLFRATNYEQRKWFVLNEDDVIEKLSLTPRRDGNEEPAAGTPGR